MNPGEVGVLRLGLVTCLYALGCARGTPAERVEEGAEADAVPAQVRCADQQGAVITGAGVGPIRIRMRVNELPVSCPIVGDTSLWLEGDLQPAVLIDVDGDTILAEVVDDRVWRITVSDKDLKTADGISVGTPVARLAVYPDAVISSGEGSFFVIAEASHCGLSFAVPQLRHRPERWRRDDLMELPDTVRVGFILVIGACHSSNGLRILWDTAEASSSAS